MGVLKRVQSLPTILDELPDATWPENEKYGRSDHQLDLQSITSESSIADILTLLQQNRGAHGATVHGSNVWELMKAAAEARENAWLEEISVESLKPQADDFLQCSDDMWTWVTDGLEPIDESDATAEESTKQDIEILNDLDSDAMWCWNPQPTPLAEDNHHWWMWRWETKQLDEASGTRVGCAIINCSPAVPSWLLIDEQEQTPMLEDYEMWDWSAIIPLKPGKKAALLWDWSWNRVEEEEPETSIEIAVLADIMWDWSSRRDDNKADKEIPLDEEEKAELEKTADLWDWSRKTVDLWDWSMREGYALS